MKQVGDYNASVISGGTYWIDGGGIFGIIPRVLWSPSFPPDELNRVCEETNCLLLEQGEQKILIDTGYGSKLSTKRRQQLNIPAGEPLAENLQAAGIAPEEISHVILSHLHFDHAGGLTRQDETGQFIPVFPNAEHVVQQQEWEAAFSGWPELKGAYTPAELEPIAQTGQLRLIDQEEEIVPGIWGRWTGGHSLGHQAIVIEDDREPIYFLGDICSSLSHLSPLWSMAFDMDLLQTRRVKQSLLTEIAERSGWIVFDHDPYRQAAQIEPDPTLGFRGTVIIDQL